MKFPRNVRILQNRLDAAPFAAVFFLLVIFVLLRSLVYTPGVRLELPAAEDLSGTDAPTVSVAIGTNGALYYEDQLLDERALSDQLRRAAAKAPAPLTLVIRADKRVTYDMLLHLSMLASKAGITNGLLAALPRGPAKPTAGSAP
jgi:biopolymer transport protein ExbD